MSDTQVDQLRDALRREAQDIQPVGLGVDTVQRRGRHRRNRGRTLVAVGTVTCVAGLGVSVIHRQGKTADSVAVTQQPGSGTPPPALAFRTVDGTLSFTSTHFTTAGGVTYALSTAPGVAGQPPEAAQGQAIYRTTDGEHWTAADQTSDWITDLSERDGVLYAVGTAPGAATAADVRYRVATSHDDGKAWSNTDLPFDLSTPSAKVPVSRDSSVQVASGPTATVALLHERFFPDLTSLVAARTAGNPNVSTEMTNDGFVMRDLSACMSAKDGGNPGIVNKADAERRRAGKCSDTSSLGTISWADVGISGPADLTREQMLVSTDGTHWDSVAAPSTGFVTDLMANDGGFLLLAVNDAPTIGDKGSSSEAPLWRSSDARQWTPVSTPVGLSVQGIAGNRIVGIDDSGAVQTSTDGGTTWHATAIASELPAGSPVVTTWATDAGPLGFGVVVTADANPKDDTRGHDYLLFSSDGISWSTTDLATAGEPVGAALMQVTVGSDHIGVDYESAGAKAGGPLKITTLLATPKR